MAQRKYDQKLKDEAIDAIVKNGRSVAQTARDYDIPEGTLYAIGHLLVVLNSSYPAPAAVSTLLSRFS